MKNLKCDVDKCVYNKHAECFAGKINVDGCSATSSYDTYCATFRENEHNGFSSNTGCCCDENHVVGTNEIKCEAVKCMYNHNKLCSANSVEINNLDASCKTFRIS